MSKYTLTYQEQFDGATAVAKAGAQIRDLHTGSGTVWDCNAGDYATCTGYIIDMSDTDFLIQTTSSLYLIVNLNNPDWKFTEGKKLKSISKQNAQDVVNMVVENNRHIIQNNLFCARFANKLSSAEKTKLFDLQIRLEERNQALKNELYIESAVTSSPAGYSNLLPYLQNFMNSSGNGSVGLVLSTTAVIVISAFVVASIATAAYYAFKAYAAESAQDVKFSDELTKTLMEKLTPEEYKQLEQETKGIVTKARLKERLKSSAKTILLTIAACAVGAFVLFKRKE
ncbi:MAG: hypothetical protein NC346_09025 [Prevotella sp.]|nr:hypothetical protein [Prevotella sp.]MCM1443664.1 hypothetical protein [Muribaculum sp.]MCM1577153.1 hypothetical protein [Bacteroides sp.]